VNIKNDPRLAYLLVNLATLLWASNIALGRALRDQISPAMIVTIRAGIAGAIYLALLLTIYRSQLKRGIATARSEWLPYLGMGFAGVFAYPVLMYLALQYTTATHAALINAVGPLVTMLLAALMLKEPINSRLVGGGVLSLAGVSLIISNGSLRGLIEQGLNRGDAIMLGIVFLWGLYSVWSRVATRQNSSLWVTAVSTWLGLPFLIPTAAIEWQSSPTTFTLPLILMCIYVGIFPTVIAFLAWNEGVRRVGPNHAMAFYNMLAVYGALFGILFLGERLSLELLAGGALVIAGGLFVALQGSGSLTGLSLRRKRGF
jgi:drug/metabolite transporter (DMT)-like permease